MSTAYIRLPTGTPTYPSASALPPTAANGSLAVTLDTYTVYVFDGQTQTWLAIGGTSVPLSVGAINGQPDSANGASIAANQLFMQTATPTFPGLVTTGNLTDVGTDGITVTNGTNAVNGSGTSLSQHVADTTHNGYLSSTDWNTFNNKQPAGSYLTTSLTSSHLFIGNGSNIATDTALSGDATISNTGTLTLSTVNSNVGSFGSSTSIPNFTVNAKGLITVAGSNVVIAPAGTLTGTTLASNVVSSSLTSLGTQSVALNMGSHQINAVTDPTSAQDAATKNYVDTVASGLQPIQAVYAATTGSNISGTYLNGVAGVGATFTTTSTSTFTVDGVTPPLNSRVLIKDQSSGFQNGVYNITQIATGVLPTIFTRSLDYDTASDMNAGSLVPVINGTTNAQTSWLQTATITTVGTDSLVFTQWTANPGNYLLKANNLSDVASKSTSFNNISPMTTGGDIIYGGTAGAGTRLANGSSGQVLTSNGGTSAPSWQTVTSSGPTTFFENTSTTPQTVTLPAPTNGEQVIVKDISGNAQTNNITINPHASELIDGGSSLVITFNYGFVQLESDGTNWYVTARSSNISAWSSSLSSSFSPNGFGTVTNQSIFYRRVGDTAEVRGTFTGGTNTAATCYIGLPSALTIDTTKLPSNSAGTELGIFYQVQSGSQSFFDNHDFDNTAMVFYDNSTSTQAFVTYATSSSVFEKVNTSSFLNNNEGCSFSLTIPVSGWGVY